MNETIRERLKESPHLPVVEQGSGTVHHVGQGGLDKSPPRDGLEGGGEGWRQSEFNVLHEDLFKRLQEVEVGQYGHCWCWTNGSPIPLQTFGY